MFFFNYIELNDDIKQIINYILLYCGHQNDGDTKCFYYDQETDLRFEVDWSSGKVNYSVRYISVDGCANIIIDRFNKQYIHRKFIPILLDIYNNIPQENINKVNIQIKNEKENNDLLNKTVELRALCWSLLEYKDDYLTLSLNTHEESDDYYGTVEAPDGHRVVLSNGKRVFDYSGSNIYKYEEGEWINYLSKIKNNRFDSEEERIKYINRIVESEKESNVTRNEYYDTHFQYANFDPLDNNKYLVKGRIKK